MKSRINNPYRMKQLIDFQCIIFEIKYGGADVPVGQKFALQRMEDDFTKVDKQAVALVCEHTVHDAEKPVIAAWCKVREIYYGKEKQRRAPDPEITVREAVDNFQRYLRLVADTTRGDDEV